MRSELLPPEHTLLLCSLASPQCPHLSIISTVIILSCRQTPLIVFIILLFSCLFNIIAELRAGRAYSPMPTSLFLIADYVIMHETSDTTDPITSETWRVRMIQLLTALL